ncbi:MAG: 16S rRNA (guanine(527)-N(7))-methyltransferase RsmG [Rhodobacteraceae bacterium]|nr:MAG: 16S rRNA (guanine(527)-N(7))-methyltransferase RsmG [Paracoccaceae bacterium]
MNDIETVKQTLTEEYDVSRETLSDLERLVELLVKWNKAINLVGKSTLDQVWSRHILDSAQIWSQRPADLRTWVDLGSGGGFPALVLAILAKKDAPNAVFHMIESDVRKCSFLRTVSRETFSKTEIHAVRIESAPDIQADVVSARALASVDQLLSYSEKFLGISGFCLFLKGQGCVTEVENAQESWKFEFSTTQSLTDLSAQVLKVWNIARAND